MATNVAVDTRSNKSFHVGCGGKAGDGYAAIVHFEIMFLPNSKGGVYGSSSSVHGYPFGPLSGTMQQKVPQ